MCFIPVISWKLFIFVVEAKPALIAESQEWRQRFEHDSGCRGAGLLSYGGLQLLG